jgi:hypothetical protein
MTHEPAQQTDGPKPPSDPIFPRLVSESEGTGQKLIGLLAYGLYHDAKREWISDFRAREGHYPSDKDLREYERSWTASRLEALQNAAAQLITSYTDSVVSQAEMQILRNALKGGVWRAAARWAVGALLYTFIMIGVVFGLASSGIDLVGLLERVASHR